MRPGIVCRCLREGCTGYMQERQWEPSPEVRFRWKRARESLLACRRLMLLDLGNDRVLRIGRFAPVAEMTGSLYTGLDSTERPVAIAG